MKVYIITKEPFPKGMAATNRISNYAKGIIANGIECEVLIAKRTEYKLHSNGNTDRIGIFQTIPFTYVSPTVYRNKSLFIRKFVDIIDLVRLFIVAKCHFRKGDILFDYTNSIALKIMIKIISVCFKVQVISELCEYPYAPMKKNFFYQLKQWIMLHAVFPYFDGFIVISNNLQKVAERYGSKRAKILKVPILVDIEQAHQIEAFTSSIPYIFHAGTLTEQKDAFLSTLQAYAMAVKQLDFPIIYYVAGDDKSHWKEIQAIIQSNKIEDSIVFLGKLSHKRVLSYWKGASLAILNKNDNLQNRHGFSTKLGEILLSETAVITTTVGEANNYLKDGQSAYIVEPQSSDLIAEKIIQAFRYPEERKRIAKNGKAIAKTEFDVIYQGKRLSDFLKQIVDV